MTSRGNSTRGKPNSRRTKPTASRPAWLVPSKRAPKTNGQKQPGKTSASSESKLRALFAAMQDVVLIIDKDGIYREIAPTNPGLLYKPPEELLGRSLKNVFPPLEAEQFMSVTREVLATQQLKQIEYQLQIGESTHWFSTNVTPLDADLTVWVAHDISNRKAAEETLRQSEANYRSLFENIPDGIYRTTPDGRILSANPALVRMFGFEEEEEFKQKYSAAQMYSNPADRNRFMQLLEKQNEIHNAEIALKRRDGSQLIVLENARVVRNEEGKTLFYEGVLTDITERKRMEDTLRESEAFSQAILNNSPIGISVRDRTGRFLSANEAWKKIWAMPESDVVENTAHERSALKFDSSDDYLGAYQADVRRVYEQGGHLHLPELKITHPRPGAAEWIAQHFYAIQDATGQVDRVVILTEDITERKQAEKALRESEWRNKIVSNLITDYIFVVDVDPRGNLALRWASDSMLRVTGRTIEDAATSNMWGQIIHPDDVDRFFNFANQILTTARSDEIECRSFNVEGKQRWIRIFAQPQCDERNVVMTIVGAVQDITARKQTEEELRLAKETAEVASQALQQALDREMVLSRTDSLTEAFNRRYFFEVANHEFEVAKRYQRPLSIVMFDIDNFKQFNDTHGHQAGDEILKCVAQATHQQLRGADILARYGGDEFVILLSNSNAQEAVTVAERVQENIAAYLKEIKHYQASITTSMGIAEFLSGVDSVDQLVQHADKALYDAKNAGRNCVIVHREEAD